MPKSDSVSKMVYDARKTKMTAQAAQVRRLSPSFVGKKRARIVKILFYDSTQFKRHLHSRIGQTRCEGPHPMLPTQLYMLQSSITFQLTNRWPRFLAFNPSGSVGTYSEFRAKDLALDWSGRGFESPRPQNNNTLPRVGPPPRDVRFQQSRHRVPAERT